MCNNKIHPSIKELQNPEIMKSILFLITFLFTAIFTQLQSYAKIYEAETADLYKAVIETKNSGYFGESYVNFDNVPESYLEIKIGMADAGEQEIIFRFANGTAADRQMEIKLNDEVIKESLVFKSTGSWTNWDTISIQANLNEGINVFRCTSIASEGGPNLDQFEVSGEQEQSFILNLSVDGDGQIVQQPEKGLLFKGESITLIARPDYTSVFKDWSGDFSSENDTLEFILDGDKTIAANFLTIEIYPPEPDFSMIGYATVPGEGVETTTGGENGKVIYIETLAQLIAWGASREDNYTAETIIIKGKIEAETTTVITVKRGKDISILGDSESNGGFAELKNISINIRDYSNVIVRNLKMHEVFYPDDDLTIDECHHVWIDHCEFHSKIGPGIGIDTYDGLLDIKKGSHNVTVSWCYFHDHMKTVLVGHSDNNGEQDVNLQITFHHNWFSNTDGRNPSLRFGQIHYFNNYLENITDYGFAVRNGAHAKIENCHFESVKLPITSDKFDGHGFACVSGCIYSGTCSENDNQISEPLDCEFWDDQIPYEYILESVNTVNISVREYAGVGIVNPITSAQVSVQQPKEFEVLKVFVNNTNNSFDVTLLSTQNQNVLVEIYSVEGRLIAKESCDLGVGKQNIQIAADLGKSGIFLVKISNVNNSYSQKLFKI